MSTRQKIWSVCIFLLVFNINKALAQNYSNHKTEETLENTTVNIDSHIGVARSHIRNKEFDKAIVELEKVIDINSKESSHLNAIVLLAYLYIYQNNIKSVEYYYLLKKQEYELADLIYQLILLSRFSQVSLSDKGIEIIGKVGEAPKEEEIINRMRMAELFHSQSLYQKAIDVYAGILDEFQLSDSEKAGIYYIIGGLYHLYGSDAAAIKNMEKAVYFSNSDVPKVWLMESYLFNKDYSGALNFTNTGLEKNSKDRLCLYYQGQIYFNQQYWEKAIKAWDNLKGNDDILFALVGIKYKQAQEQGDKGSALEM